MFHVEHFTELMFGNTPLDIVKARQSEISSASYSHSLCLELLLPKEQLRCFTWNIILRIAPRSSKQTISSRQDFDRRSRGEYRANPNSECLVSRGTVTPAVKSQLSTQASALICSWLFHVKHFLPKPDCDAPQFERSMSLSHSNPIQAPEVKKQKYPPRSGITNACPIT
jgi:hypothetical protein